MAYRLPNVLCLVMPEAETRLVISQDARLSEFFMTVSTRDQWTAEDTFVPNIDLEYHVSAPERGCVTYKRDNQDTEYHRPRRIILLLSRNTSRILTAIFLWIIHLTRWTKTLFMWLLESGLLAPIFFLVTVYEDTESARHLLNDVSTYVNHHLFAQSNLVSNSHFTTAAVNKVK